jgi:putative spermidine/putrescine transport system substrate-binding protein
VAAALVFAGCGSDDETTAASGGQQEDRVLRVGMYGGSWTEAVKETAAKAFTEATGARVEYVEGNPSDLAAKVYASAAQGSDPPIDLIETDTQTQSQLAERGALMPTSEYADKAEDTFGSVETPPVNDGYAPPHCDWYIAMVYNTEKFEKANLPVPTSWDDLFDPKLAGHVAIPDIATAMGVPTIFGVSGDESPAGMTKGIERLAKLDAYSVYSSSSDMSSDFANGNVWAASATDGRAWQLVDDGQPAKVVYPTIAGSDKIGPLAGNCYLDVVKGSKNADLGAEFIKATYADRAQVDFAKLTAYLPSSPTALKTLVEENPDWTERVPDRAEAAEMDWSQIVPNLDKIVDQFNRAVGR